MEKIVVKNLVKEYGTDNNKVIANDSISFEIDEGEFVVILGPSGAGKSTLLNIIGGMDSATSGSINVFGKEIVGLNDKELTKYRREDIGFVFQFYNLIPNLTVLENVELAGQIVKQSKPAENILKQVGLEHRMNNFPSQISGGEQQRVAIARAIAKNILNILKEYCKNEKRTVIIITHNSSIAQAADKVIEIYDAKVKKVFVNQSPKNIDEIEW